MAASRRVGTQAEVTRAQLLAAAETVFATKGYAAARLEDVAERVGIRRASLVYYYRDKAQLYNAVLGSVFSGLIAQVQQAVSATTARPERVEAAVLAWVDYVAARPTTARLLLREIADAAPERPPAVVDYARPLLAALDKTLREGQEAGEFHAVDSIHLASTIAGATVFFVSATPLLGSDWPHDPLSREQIASHRAEVLRITRRLLGTPGPRPARRRIPRNSR